MSLTLIILLLVSLVVTVTICTFLRDLLKACIALGVLSAILAVVMFVMGAQMAAVFELSVCAGLITVVFISSISMTKLSSKEEAAKERKLRRKRFALLPLILAGILIVALMLLWPRLDALIPNIPQPHSMAVEPDVFWNLRRQDLLGQIIMILAGVYGVLIFFRERDSK